MKLQAKLHHPRRFAHIPNLLGRNLIPHSLSLRVALISALFIGGLLAFAFSTRLGEKIRFDFEQPVNFWWRSWIGKDPHLDRRIRALAFDDSTLTRLRQTDLSTEQWLSLIQNIVKDEPSLIFIDKIFSYPAGGTELLTKLAQLFSAKTKVIVGAFFTPSRLRFGHEYLAGKARGQFPPESHFFVYGPDPIISAKVSHIGYLNYDDSGRVAVAVRYDESRVIYAAGLLAGSKLGIASEEIIVDSQQVPTDDRAQLFVNFPPPSTIMTRIHPIHEVLPQTNGGRSGFFNKGDVILILPGMYTGNTDFKKTPFGARPGGYVHISIINSVLTRQWLSEVRSPALMIMMSALFGFTGIALTRMAFTIYSLLGSLAIAGIGLLAFSHYAIIAPWSFSLLAFVSVSFMVMMIKVAVSEIFAIKLSAALHGLISKDRLEQLIKNPGDLKVEPTESIISVMCVDVVGFSSAAESLTPKEAFHFLREALSTTSAVVHEFGGILDKSLGDGLLCYFGHQLDGGKSEVNHADQAVLCAQKMQIKMANLCLKYSALGSPIFPIRIGINTGSAFIGNLGDEQRIDFSLIGHVVNIAKRIEDSCQPFMILIGSPTKSVQSLFSHKDPRLREVLLNWKHQQMVTAWELNPFADHPKLLTEAEGVYREFAKLVRQETRHLVPASLNLAVVTGTAQKGIVIDFSKKGMAVVFPVCFAKKVILKLSFSSNQHLEQALMNAGLHLVLAEVCWSRTCPQGFVHGLMIQSFVGDQGEIFLNTLTSYAGKEGLKSA